MNTLLTRGFLLVTSLLVLVACPGAPSPSGPPEAPSGLIAEAEEGQIRLLWQDNSRNEAGFRIFRRVDEEAPITTQQDDFTEVDTVAANVTEYLDSSVDINKSYFYRVEAYNAQGQSRQTDMTDENSVRPEPPAGDVRIRILRSGSGSGLVSSNPAGIECDQKTGGDCSSVFSLGQTVTLTATPAENTSFEGWSGACTGTAPCQLTLSQELADEIGNIDVTVNFLQTGNSLTVEKTGSGSGRVFDVNSGGSLIDCGTDCSEVGAPGTVIVVEAAASGSSLFGGWENCPKVENSGKWCRLTLDSDLTVEANFTPPVAAINSFVASPTRVPLDGEVALSWNVTGSEDTTLSLEASDEDGTRPISISGKGLTDSVEVTVRQSTTFTLKAISEAGESSAEQTVTVGNAPTVTKFAPVDDDLTVLPNSEITLSWGVAGEGAITVTLTGEGVNRDLSDDGDKRTKVTVPASGTARYTLTATSPFGSDSETLTFQIGKAPTISSFTADDSTVTAGSSVNLSWAVSGADSLKIDNGVGVVTSSPKSVTVNRTTTYTLTATNAFGETKRTTTVTVGTAAAITSFGLEGGDVTVEAGSPITLEWTVTGTPTSLRLTGSGIPPTDRNVLGETDYSFTAPSTPGTYSYTLTADNVYGEPDSAVYTLTVGAANTAPETSPSDVSTEEGSSVVIALQASDADGDTLEYIVVKEPEHGTLTGSGASRTYTPNADFVGEDEFRFKVNDGQTDSNVSKVSITVLAVSVNNPPIAENALFTVNEGESTTVDLIASDPDGDLLTLKITGLPSNGTLIGSGASRTYVPDDGFTGTDSFKFKANDGEFDSNEATVTIRVLANVTNTAPETSPSDVSVEEGSSVLILLQATDADDDALAYVITQEPEHGTLTGSGASRTYTPEADFVGEDEFRFKVNDGTDDSNVSKVIVTVTATATASAKPEILSFEVSETELEEGDEVTLSWTILSESPLTMLEIKRDEDYEEIDVALTSLTEEVEETTKYRLRATNAEGSTLSKPPITVEVDDD